MKKQEPQFLVRPGWTGITGFTGKCLGCLKRVDAKERAYWRETSRNKFMISTTVRCEECLKDEPSA